MLYCGAAESDSFLIERDPHRFMQIVRIDDRKKRLQACPNSPVDVFACELVRYGITRDPSLRPSLLNLYVEGVLPTLDEERRFSLYTRVRGMLERQRLSVDMLTPFLLHDPSAMIAGSAAVDVVSLSDAPLVAAAQLIARLENGALANRGAVFGGLLHMGDPRVVAQLLPLRDTLRADEVREAMWACSNLLFDATVTFYLDWIDARCTSIDGLDPHCASRADHLDTLLRGLVLYVENRDLDYVFFGERQLPSGENDSPVEGMRHQPIDAYAPTIASRLRAIAVHLRAVGLSEAETARSRMPAVWAAWGLAPNE